MIPDGLLYSADHQWIRVNGKRGRMGITHHAQDALGTIVYIELPVAGRRVAASEPLGVVESVKAVSEYYSPVSGKVTAVNSELQENPGLINEDPYGLGWIAEIDLEDPAELDKLLSAGDYRDFLARG